MYINLNSLLYEWTLSNHICFNVTIILFPEQEIFISSRYAAVNCIEWSVEKYVEGRNHCQYFFDIPEISWGYL